MLPRDNVYSIQSGDQSLTECDSIEFEVGVEADDHL
jgi:hypothetical protein